MSERICLIIDDEDQERVFEASIKQILKKEGYNVSGLFINTTDPELLDEENNIDGNKLKERIKQLIDGKSIDIIATDFNLSDDNINGVQVVAEIRKIRAKVPVLIYSGKLDEAIKYILGDYKTKDSTSLIKGIRTLMEYNILDYVNRNEYPSAIIKQLKNKTAQLDLLLLQKLREYSSYQFKSCYPHFNGRNLDSIANEIDKQTPQGRAFQEELIEQCIAYLIQINEDEE